MLRTRSAAILIIVGSLSMLAPASAQYSGPNATVTLNSVAAVLAQPVDDQPVILQGHLTRQLSKEKYLFSDGTGEIRVDIDDKYLRGIAINEKTRVELRGEVEKDFLTSPEIDVDTIRILQ